MFCDRFYWVEESIRTRRTYINVTGLYWIGHDSFFYNINNDMVKESEKSIYFWRVPLCYAVYDIIRKCRTNYVDFGHVSIAIPHDASCCGHLMNFIIYLVAHCLFQKTTSENSHSCN